MSEALLKFLLQRIYGLEGDVGLKIPDGGLVHGHL